MDEKYLNTIVIKANIMKVLFLDVWNFSISLKSHALY